MTETKFPSSKTSVLLGPSKIPTSLAITYEPVECDFTDDLEFVSIKKIFVEVKHWNLNGEPLVSLGYIVDIFTKEKEEFLTMSDTSKIRLDRIHEIRITEKDENCVQGVCQIKK